MNTKEENMKKIIKFVMLIVLAYFNFMYFLRVVPAKSTEQDEFNKKD